jgi:DNA-binding CsgD family transcriptional regulator
VLHISVRTVESHRYNLMQKLGIKNAAGLVRYAVLQDDLTI